MDDLSISHSRPRRHCGRSHISLSQANHVDAGRRPVHPTGDAMPHERAEEAPAVQTDLLSRAKSWQHYYEYFHKLDADMQVRLRRSLAALPCVWRARA